MMNNYYPMQPQRQMPQPMVQQSQVPPIAQPQQPMDERIWVQSEIAAEAYLVGANNIVTLWDSAKPIIYVKSSDIYGRPLPLEKYEYKKIDEQQQTNEFSDALEELRARIEALEQKGVKANAKSKSNADDATA